MVGLTSQFDVGALEASGGHEVCSTGDCALWWLKVLDILLHDQVKWSFVYNSWPFLPQSNAQLQVALLIRGRHAPRSIYIGRLGLGRTVGHVHDHKLLKRT